MTRYSDYTIGDIQDDLKHITSLKRRGYSDMERGKGGSWEVEEVHNRERQR